MKKKVTKIILFIVLTPIILVVLLALALYCPPIQNWAVEKATAYASKETGMQISIDNVRLTFPLNLQLNDIRVIDKKDTIADIHSLLVDVQLWPLLDDQVNIDALEFNYMNVNTSKFIKAAHIKGGLNTLRVESHGIDIKKEFVNLDKAIIDGANFDITLADSVPEDTTKSENFWKIKADIAKVSNSRIHLMGKDMDVLANIKDLKAEDGNFDLFKSEYKLSHAELRKSDFAYNDLVSLTNTSAMVDSLYFCAPNISVNLGYLSFTEHPHGLEMKRMAGKIAMDSTQIHVRDFSAETPYSNLQLGLHMDMNAFEEKNPGKLQLAFDGSIGKKDLELFKEYIPAGYLGKLPNEPILIAGALEGNMQSANINNFSISIPNTISLKAYGSVTNPTDINRLRTKLTASLDCKNIDFLTQFVDKKMLEGTGIKLPHGLPLTASVSMSGGMSNMLFEDLRMSIPGKMNIYAKGKVLNLNNMNNFASDLNLQFDVPNIDFLTACISPNMLAGTGIVIPHGIGLKGSVGMKGNDYIIDLTATEGGGWLKIKGSVNPAAEQYDVDAQAHQFAVNHFMPSMGVGRVTANAKAKGKGYDPFAKSTNILTKANIQSLQYSKYNITNVDIDAKIANARAKALVDSNNPYLRGKLDVNALLSSKVLDATIVGDVSKINFYKLGFTKAPFTMGLCSNVEINYDYGDNLMVSGMISDLNLTDSTKTFHPDDIILDINSSPAFTHAQIDCGDLYMLLDAQGSYNSLLNKFTKLGNTLVTSIENKTFNTQQLWATLPDMHLDFKSGPENPFSRFLKFQGTRFEEADIHLNTAPDTGINGNAYVYGVNSDSIMIDTIRLNIESDAEKCLFAGQVRNGKENPQFVFNSLFNGRLKEHGVEANITLKDKKDITGIQIGADATLSNEGINLTLLDDKDIILGYQKFKVYKDNYIFLANNNRISADMKLRSSDGKGIGVYTNDDNEDALQDITLTLNKINLQEILSAVPYAPDVRGILDGDFHYIQDEKSFSVSSSSGIKKLNYEGLDIGNVSSEFVYMPEENGGHHIDGDLFMDDKEICSIVGGYLPADEAHHKPDSIDAVVTLKSMPMHMANGFIPDQLFGLKGKGEGDLTIKGSTEKPRVNGEIFLDSCHLYSLPYGVDLRISDDPVRIIDSKLMFENFEVFANNNNPLSMAGYLDFSDMSKMYLDMRLKASNFDIIDAKENARSEAYGKMFVDFFGTMKGRVDNLTMKGKLDVLPSTNLSYILRDSPITTDNQLEELVKFVDMSDTTTVHKVERPTPNGFKMDMNINVLPGTQVMAYLNTDHSNYVDASGNGSLRMMFNPAENLTLTGRYNLAGGKMKYSLPIIPLKTFEIQENSYVEFTGDISNPHLNITAVEKNKAQVNVGNSGARTVEFECGVIITKTLNDMGLEFTLDAPEDLEMNSSLAAMSKEMRGKLAVTMLTTGMYLADGNTSTFTMNTALNQFLQSEINNITGNALRTLDLSIGMDNSTDNSGNTHTDYSFKFAKRFWNNRLKVSIGGKVSTGGNMDKGSGTSVFDNMELEYRLDASGNKFLNLYYDNNSYDWLDGTTREFGGGFIWRRSVSTFKELFNMKELVNFGKENQPSDTITIKE